MNHFRLLFSWEALADSAYKATLDSRVAYIRSHGCTVVLDIHHGEPTISPRYKDVAVTPGSSQEATFTSMWASVATQYKADPGVHFGVINEPNGQSVQAWFTTAQRVINAIRATGNTSRIWMPGGSWDGAGGWTSTNGSAWNLTDSAHNLGVQAHLYFDANAGGGDTTIQSTAIGQQRLADVASWARSKGLQVLLGEVGLSASNSLASAAWANLMAYAEANADVVAGWCFWAYGPPVWWSGYQFTLCNNSKQMQLIKPSLAATAPPPPVTPPVVVPPTVPDPRDQTILDLQNANAVLSAKIASAKAALA